MKLFAIYIGGEYPGANIEVHDVRFAVAQRIEDTYPALREQWWGVPRSLHIDCWAEVIEADGYAISLKDEPYDGPEKLYFVNLGGYEPGEFAERHRNIFVVAESESKAKYKAVKTVKTWTDPHKDDLYEAEHAFCLSDGPAGERLFVHLTPIAGQGQPAFTCKYIPIRKAT